MTSISKSRSYGASADRLYAAALKTVPQLGYSMYFANSTARTLSFKTGVTLRSFGQDFTITVSEDGPNASTIVIGGGAPGAFYDWGEAKNIVRQFFNTLATVVQQTAEQIHQPDDDGMRTRPSPQITSFEIPSTGPAVASLGKTEALNRTALVRRVLGVLLIIVFASRLLDSTDLPKDLTDTPIWVGRKTCSVLLNQLFIFEALGSCLMRPNLVGWVVIGITVFVLAALFKSE
jgi:hypothetical protein